MKNFENVYNSFNNTDFIKFQLANGYISNTEILFEVEKIIVNIDAKGNAEFFNLTGELLKSVEIQKQTGGKEVYTEILCDVENSAIVLKFPIVEWIDNYPNCDGEYDRWDSKVIGYTTLTYNIETQEVTVL